MSVLRKKKSNIEYMLKSSIKARLIPSLWLDFILTNLSLQWPHTDMSYHYLSFRKANLLLSKITSFNDLIN